MKLSEAIRAGAKLTPKGIGTYFDEYGGTCAVGAACLAQGFKNDGKTCVVDFFNAQFPLLKRLETYDCPYCTEGKGKTASSMIFHLNDKHLSREAIAEWVETVENKLEADAAKPMPADELARVFAL